MLNVLKAVAMAMILTGPALVHAEKIVIACGPMEELEQCRKGAEAWARKTGHEVEVRPTREKVVIACGPLEELEQCKKGAEAWARKTGHVEVKPTGEQEGVERHPLNTSEQFDFVQKQLKAHSPDLDVYRVDVTWPGLLAEHFIDLKPYVSEEVLKQHFPAIVQNNTVGGGLVAMPWFIDAGVLYYRKDLLKKYGKRQPTTWEELTNMAKEVQEAERKAGNHQMWGFVFEAHKGEMLTCNALEWISSFGGGTLVDENGKVTIHGSKDESKDDSKAVKALTMAASWINVISPQGVLNYEEHHALGDFLAGNAVFMRNWAKEWVNIQATSSTQKGRMAVMALPKGGPDGKSTGTLGGWQLAVSKYSKHPEIAADLVKYLTSPEEQKRRAIEATFSPTVMALYKDRGLLKARPFYASLLEIFTNAVARPSRVTGRKYVEVSEAFHNAVHAILWGSSKPEDELEKLRKTLERMSNEGNW